MGIDVNLYAVGEVSDEQFEAAGVYVKERVQFDQWSTFDRNYDGHVELWTGHRYYGPGYERGPWPQIYAEIRAMQAALPWCAVYYGGDCSDEGEKVTPEMLDKLWAHWLSAAGNNYRRDSDLHWHAPPVAS